MGFLHKINRAQPGLALRLPTEAEWENACRAGTTTPFSSGQNLTKDQANYISNRGKTISVNALPAKQWGMYQMHGNIWEWCADWYGPNETGPVLNPSGPDTGDYRVLRGGSWIGVARLARSAFRFRQPPSYRNDGNGFRLARGL